MIIIPEHSPKLIVPKLEYAHMQKSGIGEVLSYTEFPAHGIPKVDDRMGKGPLVGLSYLRVNGYGAEVERTYFHTKPSIKEKKVYSHMLKARDLAVSMVRQAVTEL